MDSMIWTNKFFNKKKSKLTDALKKVSLFSKLDNKEIKKIAEIAYIRRYKEEEIVFKKDEPSYGLFIVLKGEVEVSLYKRKKKLSLGNYKQSEFFGEFSLIEDEARRVNAIAKDDSVLCYLFKEDLKKLFIKNSEIGLAIYEKIIQFLVEKLEYADDYMMKQSQKVYEQSLKNEKNIKQQ